LTRSVRNALLSMIQTARRYGALTSMIAILTSQTLLASPAHADDLDTAIESGFGKLVKYGRWLAALVAAVFFVLGIAQRAQNSDNPHEQGKGTRQAIIASIAFVAIIGYKLVLTGLVKWFGISETDIPSFLWQ
jgi:hypothetical protein